MKDLEEPEEHRLRAESLNYHDETNRDDMNCCNEKTSDNTLSHSGKEDFLAMSGMLERGKITFRHYASLCC